MPGFVRPSIGFHFFSLAQKSRQPVATDIVGLVPRPGGGGATGTSNVLATPSEFGFPLSWAAYATRFNDNIWQAPLDQDCATGSGGSERGETAFTLDRYWISAATSLGIGTSGSSVTTTVHQGPPENSCDPRVDVCFRSGLYSVRCLAVVLTGMAKMVARRPTVVQ